MKHQDSLVLGACATQSMISSHDICTHDMFELAVMDVMCHAHVMRGLLCASPCQEKEVTDSEEEEEEKKEDAGDEPKLLGLSLARFVIRSKEWGW